MSKMLKAVLMALMLGLAGMSAMAYDLDPQVEYTDAIQKGDMKVIKKYYNKLYPVNQLFFGWSGLQIAANKGPMSSVKFFVENGADVNYKHPVNKMTALHMAAFQNRKDVVTYLIEHGADVNARLRADVSIVRALNDEGMTEMAAMLEAAGAKDDGCQEKCF